MRRASNVSAADVGRWLDHSDMSNPGPHAGLLNDLPADGLGALVGVIQGLSIHADWLDDYLLDKQRAAAHSRETLSIAERSRQILEFYPSPLRATRPPGSRSVGTCRDFS